MSHLVIKAERTPNPNAIKFCATRRLNSGPARNFHSAGAAQDDPVASRLFVLRGVVGVMFLDDFCCVSQDGTADWDELIPKIEAVLYETYEAM